MSVNVFSRKVLIEDTIFTSPTGDATAIIRGHPSHAKVYPFAGQREYLHFSVSLRPWVLVRPRESNPRPPALQSSALPTELILLRSNVGNVPRHNIPWSVLAQTPAYIHFDVLQCVFNGFNCGGTLLPIEEQGLGLHATLYQSSDRTVEYYKLLMTTKWARVVFLRGICTCPTTLRQGAGGTQSDQCPCLRTYRSVYCRAKYNNQEK